MTGYINKTLAYEHCHKINYDQHGPWDTPVQTATCTELNGKILCSVLLWNSSSVYWRTYPFLCRCHCPLKWQNPCMNFSSSFMPIDLRYSVPTGYYPSSQRRYDGSDHIPFYDKHGDKQTRWATNARRGAGNELHWRYYFDHSPCLSLWIYRMSIKSFPDYRHLLQENYVEYKHIDMDMSYARRVRTASLTSYSVICKILHQRTASHS
jgi:hypothetical protein